ncbi:MAG: hypothetical protein HUK20_12635, partial [Fibrobacter sp.]|nr:hypothetical protein [Fibrobacter sp.]
DCGDEACKANALRDVLAQREGMYLQLGTGHQACAENAKMKIWGLVPTDDESYYTEFFKAEFEKVPDSLKVKSDKQLAEEKNDGKVQTWQPGQAVDMSMFMANYNQLAANMAPAYYYDWSVGVRSANDIKILKLLKRAAEWKMLDMPAKTKHSAADEKMVKAEFAKYNPNKVLKVFIDPDWKIEKNNYGTILRRTREARVIIADPNDKNVHLLYSLMLLVQEYQGGGKYTATKVTNYDNLKVTDDPCMNGLFRVKNYK